jgi:hypothetical protein
MITTWGLGSGFKVQGSRFRVQGSRFKVQGSRFKYQVREFRVGQRTLEPLNSGTLEL